MPISKKAWHCLLPIGIHCLLGSWLSARSLQFQIRFDLSCIYDNNVLESISNPESGNSARILTNIQCSKDFINRAQLHLNYRGGLEGYRTLSTENRIIQHASLIYSHRLTRFMTIGLEPQARWRTFFQDDRGYSWQKLEAFAQISLPLGFLLRGMSSLSQMDAEGRQFDYHSRADGFKIMWKASRKLLIYSGYSSELMNYRESALDVIIQEPNYIFFYPKDYKQKNLLMETTLGLEWLGLALVHLKINCQTQFSNSYGYDFDKPEVELIMVKSLPYHFSFRMYGRYQHKKYLDNLTPLMQIHPDTETEENHYLLCDIIKDLNENQSIRFRMGWYQNESPFRDLYYKKTIFSIGVSQTW